MIESFLLEKNDSLKKALVSKPNVLLVKNLSITPLTIWTVLVGAAIGFIWLKGDILEHYLPLQKLRFASEDTLMQVQIVLSSIAVVMILIGVQWQKSVTLTITSDYIIIEKGITRNRKNHIVMLSDIAKITFRIGILGFFGRFGKLTIKRNDDSKLVIRTIPICVFKVINKALEK